jgi:hypothetical protein
MPTVIHRSGALTVEKVDNSSSPRCERWIFSDPTRRPWVGEHELREAPHLRLSFAFTIVTILTWGFTKGLRISLCAAAFSTASGKPPNAVGNTCRHGALQGFRKPSEQVFHPHSPTMHLHRFQFFTYVFHCFPLLLKHWWNTWNTPCHRAFAFS